MVVHRFGAYRPAALGLVAGLALTSLCGAQVLGQVPRPTAQSAAGTSVGAAHASASAASQAHLGQSYAEFALGKWAELQARSDTDPAALGQALEHYRAALREDPQSAFLAAQVADVLSRVGRNAEAIRLMETTVQAHPHSTDAHQALANIYLRELSLAPQPIASGEAKRLLDKTIAEYRVLIQLDPRQADYHVVLGKLYGAEGDPPSAEREFRTALTLSPTSGDALSSLVRSLAARDRLDLAQREIAGLPAVARNGRVYATLGEAYLQHHKFTEAAAAFRQAVEAAPDAPSYQNALAQALMDGGDYAHALVEFQRLEREVPDDGHAALRVSQMELQMGHLDAAAASLQKARQLLPPDDLEVAYAGALLAQSQGDLTKARQDLETLAARKTNPATQSIFLTQLARLEMQTGDAAAAASSLQRLDALGHPYAERAQSLAIRLYTQQRDYPQALAAARTALNAHPDSRELRLTYANLLIASGDAPTAEQRLNAMLQGSASDRELYLALSRAYLSTRDWVEAEQDAKKADQLAQTPSQHAEAIAALANVALAQTRYPDAAAQLRHALVLDPNNATVLNALSFALAEAGVQLNEALDYAQQAVALDGDNGAYLDSLGWVYFKLDRLPQAIAKLQEAARLEVHDPVVLDHLAQAYARSGHWQEAESSWTQAEASLKLNPGEVTSLPALRDRIQKGLTQSRHELGK